MSISNDGYHISIFWREVIVNNKPAKELVMKVNDQEFTLYPWIGKRLEDMNVNPPEWKRDKSFDYIPDEMSSHLRKIGESKSQKRIHMENKYGNQQKE